MFQKRLSGEQIGFTVLGIFVITKSTVPTVGKVDYSRFFSKDAVARRIFHMQLTIKSIMYEFYVQLIAYWFGIPY
jgi:hypothetical protein